MKTPNEVLSELYALASMHKVCFRIRGGDVYLFEGIYGPHYWQALRHALQLVGCRLSDVTVCKLD